MGRRINIRDLLKEKVDRTELAGTLARTYTKYGLTTDEFILLNAYCMHSSYCDDQPDMAELESMTGKSNKQIKELFRSLYEREKIDFIENDIDTQKLFRNLKAILDSEKSIASRIMESKQLIYDMGGYQIEHMGHVELVPYKEGIAVIANNSRFPKMWSKPEMLKLATEIKAFADSIDDDYAKNYNSNLIQQQKNKEESERKAIEERQKQWEEERRKREIPKPGYVFLLQFPNDTHKFTYTVSLTPEQKSERIKLEYGDNVQIVHTLETYDTMKFFHKFLKTQFSSRLLEGNYSIYKLTDIDIEFLKEEKFPANAMEWFEGSVPNENVEK